ncbi:unannotated protein [freshwater metagenome]|uniref:Unannotated protein n=1 Tax=freshwater metagenome TaxID=449393 RepID=A0A6J7DHG3_9ZZZZ
MDEPAPESAADGVGALLRRRREGLGLSLRSCARAAGISPGHLSRIERGLAGPSVETLARMVGALGIDAGQLFTEDRTGDQEPPRSILLARLPGGTVVLEHGGHDGWCERPGTSDELALHVLDGTLELHLAGEVLLLAAGTGTMIPAGTPYRTRFSGPTNGRLLWIAQGLD